MEKKGFVFQGHHYTWDENTGYYWSDDAKGVLWFAFKPVAVPKDVIWDAEVRDADQYENGD